MFLLVWGKGGLISLHWYTMWRHAGERYVLIKKQERRRGREGRRTKKRRRRSKEENGKSKKRNGERGKIRRSERKRRGEKKREEGKKRKEKKLAWRGEKGALEKSRIARIIRNKADHTVKCVFHVFLSSLWKIFNYPSCYF